jgi:hypothetical protein
MSVHPSLTTCSGSVQHPHAPWADTVHGHGCTDVPIILRKKIQVLCIYMYYKKATFVASSRPPSSWAGLLAKESNTRREPANQERCPLLVHDGLTTSLGLAPACFDSPFPIDQKLSFPTCAAPPPGVWFGRYWGTAGTSRRHGPHANAAATVQTTSWEPPQVGVLDI